MSDMEFELDLARELPRYQATPELRAAIRRGMSPEPRPRSWWWVGVLSAGATAMVLTLAWASFGASTQWRAVPGDPLNRLARAVMSEHARNLIWGDLPGPDFRPHIVPAALPWLRVETGVGHRQAFIGDGQLAFVGGDPVYLDGRRGVALHYRDYDGHSVSYIALPAAGVRIPKHLEVQVGPHRPALLRTEGFALWIWKEGELACFLVSDLVSESDVERFKAYFLRIREATQPFIG
jgi:anti-sigma factor RsiW